MKEIQNTDSIVEVSNPLGGGKRGVLKRVRGKRKSSGGVSQGRPKAGNPGFEMKTNGAHFSEREEVPQSNLTKKKQEKIKNVSPTGGRSRESEVSSPCKTDR